MSESPFSGNLISLLTDTVKLSPEQTAIIETSGDAVSSKSFQELYEDVQNCAFYLSSKGLVAGDKVLLFVTPGYKLTILVFAVIYLGAIPVIIDPGMGIRSALSSIQSTLPNILIGIPLVYWASFGFWKTFKSVRKKILVTESLFTREMTIPSAKNNFKQVSPLRDDLAAIVFTSGSTGPPKGVRYLHKNFTAQVHSLKENFGLQRGEVDLATLPVFSLFNPALGITTILPEFNPRKPAAANSEKIVHAIQKFKVTTAFASPVIGRKILEYCTLNKINLPGMKRIFLAGAPSPPSLIEDLSKVLGNGIVYIPYGATEALPVAFSTSSQVIRNTKGVLSGGGSLLGQAIPEVSIKIFSSSQGTFSMPSLEVTECKQGEIGEICVSGDIVTDGYYRKPGASFDARFEFQGRIFHRMGDLGYFDDNHCLRFLGRKAECLITDQGPLETERCEPMVNAFPEVKRSALIGVGPPRRQSPCIIVELENKELNGNAKQSLRTKVLEALNNSFSEFGFSRVVWENKIPVDARHNAKIHRLSLSKKWNLLIDRNPKFGCKE